ncbi:hypothetical protein WMY93_015152 [Mugilogobius chulae]|uniref:AIG1-type G domain-containing protein n=1 Tax=Mugilogobius chulae TaxID=88201 RepID=A0AAW0P6D0_9GOBI
MSETRIVVVGKTGVGKSSLANTIFEENVFDVFASANSGTTRCESITKEVNGRLVKWIDTPGLFDTERKEDEMKPEIVKCIEECYPGPHVFLILLPVGRFTQQEQEVVQQLSQYFSDQALDFAILLFTHGDDLGDESTIEEFASQNESLNKLLQRCGNRVHVVDNKYWGGDRDGYRSNRYQLSQLFKTIDQMMNANGGRYYNNDFLRQTLQKILVEAYRFTAGD